MSSSPFVLLEKVTDGHGLPLANYYHCLPDGLLYVRWFGHLTGDAVVAGFRKSLFWQRRLAPHALLLDRSRTSGEWDEALPWIQFEWLPETVGLGLQIVYCVHLPNAFDEQSCQAFIDSVSTALPVEVFGSSHEALAHLCRPYQRQRVV